MYKEREPTILIVSHHTLLRLFTDDLLLPNLLGCKLEPGLKFADFYFDENSLPTISQLLQQIF